jgi:capsular exopolysaccharide synthesis family protein
MNVDHNPWEGAETGNGTPNALSDQLLQAAALSSVRRNAFDIDFRRLLYLWPWVLGGIILAIIGAKVYLRYTVPVYEASVKVSMTGDEQGINLGTSSIFDTRNPMQDKADLLSAPTTLRMVVDSLDLHYSAMLQGRIKDKDLYKRLRWQILNEGLLDNQTFAFTLSNCTNEGFKWIRGASNGIGKWGVPFNIGKVQIVIFNASDLDANDDIDMLRKDPWDVAFKIASRIKVTIGEQSNTATINIEDELPQRANDILTALVSAYNYSTISYKSKSLVQSISFMNQRLAPLSDELDSIETGIARFKSAKGIVGTSAAGQLYLTQTAELDAASNSIRLQREILDALERYINDPNTREENISVVGLNDSYISGLVMQYQQLRIERNKLALSVTAENPRMVVLDSQLRQTRSNINKQLEVLRSSINLQQQNVNRQLGTAQSLLRGTPANEKVLLERQRQQEIKQSLFLLLLEKKEEANIALASTTSDVRVLAPARTGKPVSPKPLLIYAGALLIGLLIPVVYGVAKELLNTSITNKEQLAMMLSAPVIGSIDQADDHGEKFALVSKDDRSVAAEQIRALRASLRFYAKKGKPLVVLSTSSFSGEGKTFLSSNLARSYALQQQRVALLEFDMRKPKLAKRMGFKTRNGISSVLTGAAAPGDVFVADEETPLLHLYPTGAIPPNPSELISTPEMENFMQYLQANYDVIIIDSPPQGLVSDAQLLSQWSDITLVVIRFNVTPRSQVREIENWNRQNKLGRMAVVLNGVKTTGYYGYNYSPYYYRRKYGDAYYTNNNATKSKQVLKNKKEDID